MTQLALLKRKINFASDKQISHVIICTYIDKEKERLEFSLARIPHTQPPPPQPLKVTDPVWMSFGQPQLQGPRCDLGAQPSVPVPTKTARREYEPHYCLDFP